MDFGKAFSFPFEDKDWFKKIIIGGLLMLIPLLGALWLAGWSLEITKRVIRRDVEPLAGWNDFGGYLVRGFQVAIIGFVYALPIILLQLCITGVLFGIGDSASTDEITTAISILSFCFYCLVIIYSILLAFVIPAALGNFAAKEQFGAAFRFGEVFGLVRAAPAAYLLVLVGNLLAGIIAGLGLILCVVGILVTAPYANAVIGHLNGQAYNTATGAQALAPVESV